jgi:hypothetical protein
VDLIALSFVRDAKDSVRVHEIMDEEGQRLPVIAEAGHRRRGPCRPPGVWPPSRWSVCA